MHNTSSSTVPGILLCKNNSNNNNNNNNNDNTCSFDAVFVSEVPGEVRAERWFYNSVTTVTI